MRKAQHCSALCPGLQAAPEEAHAGWWGGAVSAHAGPACHGVLPGSLVYRMMSSEAVRRKRTALSGQLQILPDIYAMLSPRLSHPLVASADVRLD